MTDNTFKQNTFVLKEDGIYTEDKPEQKEEPEAAGQEQETVSIQWLKDERNILSNTASLMLPSEEAEKAKRVARCLDIAIQYIEESHKKQQKP
jgi:hypothetical protein